MSVCDVVRVIVGVVVAMCVACSSKTKTKTQTKTQTETETQTGTMDASVGCAGTRQIADGLVVERHPMDGSDCLTVVRIDVVKWPLRILTAAAHGGPRTAPKWVAEFELAGVINTSMFLPNRHSIGMLRDAKTVDNDRDNPKLGGFLAFDPVEKGVPPAVIAGRDCPGFDLAALKRRYRGIVQNYRMLDCEGRAIAWADQKTFSAAAIGVDREGRVVFLHSRTPHQMTRFNEIVAGLGLAGAVYVEGGPEASLYVKVGNDEVAEIGSFETGFHDGSNRIFWEIPNVLGFAPR